MSEQNKVKNRNLSNVLALVIAVSAVIYFAAQNPEKTSSLVFSFLGLGVVIFLHELGHFVVGKLSDIHVEAFAVGFGPTIMGFKKCENYYRIRILPTILAKTGTPDDEGLLCIKIPLKCKAGETEYQLRIFPIGGFVKFLGQEDAGADKPSDDPRSFVNKPIWKRILTVSAGVTMNILLAGALFMVIFTVGIKMPPAVVGDVVPDMPAARAGLVAGDEIISVNGRSDIDFTTVAMAAALSGANEPVNLEIKRTDDSIVDMSIVAEDVPGAGYRGFGIVAAATLEIAKVANPNDFFENTGLKAGDVLCGFEGEKIEKFWQYSEKMKNYFAPMAELTFQRPDSDEPVVFVDMLEFNGCISYSDDKGSESFVPSHVGGFVPRLKVLATSNPDANDSLLAGDIIILAGDKANPNYMELRQAAIDSADKELMMTVLRDDELVNVTVMPKQGKDGRVVIGISVGLDVNHPVVADSVNLDLPRGAQIVSIAGESVESYYDIAAALGANRSSTIKVKYKSPVSSGQIDYSVPADGDLAVVRAIGSMDLPFKPLERVYIAANPAGALKMGTRKTIDFIGQSYMTLKGLILRDISPKSLMGPVGMIAASSRIIAEREFIQYAYFLAIISACLAVMNFLPLPVLDGGYVVMAVIEKIKGSPVSVKVQEWITYAGLILIGGLFILITYNDILRVFFK